MRETILSQRKRLCNRRAVGSRDVGIRPLSSLKLARRPIRSLAVAAQYLFPSHDREKP